MNSRCLFWRGKAMSMLLSLHAHANCCGTDAGFCVQLSEAQLSTGDAYSKFTGMWYKCSSYQMWLSYTPACTCRGFDAILEIFTKEILPEYRQLGCLLA